MDLAASTRVRFLRSTTPFCWGDPSSIHVDEALDDQQMQLKECFQYQRLLRIGKEVPTGFVNSLLNHLDLLERERHFL